MAGDDVMDLLDSLDNIAPEGKSKKGSARKPKAQREKKAKDNDVLAMLDDLDISKEPKQRTSTDSTESSKSEDKPDTKGDEPKSTTAIEKDTATEEATKTEDANTDTATEATASRSIEGDIVDVGATLSSWWNRNKGGIWNSAQAAANKATEAIQSRADLATIQDKFNSVLHTIVPPISGHEQLFINIFHDMVGYPNIDRMLYEVFEQVMDQVEGGGDLHMIVQKGKERRRAGSDWDVERSLNSVRCSVENGSKLALASIEDFRRSEKTQDKTAELAAAESNELIAADSKKEPIRISELYISIQPIIVPPKSNDGESKGENGETIISTDDNSLSFVVYLADFKHNIRLVTASQSFPAEWVDWLDGDSKAYDNHGINPREWVTGWIEEGLSLAFGVIAQKYVTIRMGIKPETPKSSESK